MLRVALYRVVYLDAVFRHFVEGVL
jgi:hypothetical protein